MVSPCMETSKILSLRWCQQVRCLSLSWKTNLALWLYFRFIDYIYRFQGISCSSVQDNSFIHANFKMLMLSVKSLAGVVPGDTRVQSLALQNHGSIQHVQSFERLEARWSPLWANLRGFTARASKRFLSFHIFPILCSFSRSDSEHWESQGLLWGEKKLATLS